jgi:type II secretory pathway predicted ATPase ExeA
MYREYFGLKELPFSIAPDPRYLYMSNQHQEALAHLVYGINSEGGFVVLTGEVGTGKTTVCRCLLEQIPENCDIAFILNPKLTVEELLATVCHELGISYPEGNTSIKVFVDRINDYLLDAHARGRKTVLIIEEAQNLNTEVLEQVRLLTNLETNQRKLMQIIMLGQPEFREMLSRPELRQLAQRVTARYHLGSLSKKEVAFYVNHRLAVAGTHSKLFPDSNSGKLYRLSGGIPRLINLLCDRALLGAYVQGRYRIDKPTLTKAAREVFGKTSIRKQHRKTFRWVLASLALIGCIAALASTIIMQGSSQQASITKPTQLLPLEWTREPEVQLDKQLMLITTKDTSLSELIKSSGYDLDDKDISLFLRDFIFLNKNLKRLSVIPKETTVRLPLKNMKAKEDKIILHGSFNEVFVKQDKKFQLVEGLEPDEVVMPQLLISNRNSVVYEPVLIDNQKDK